MGYTQYTISRVLPLIWAFDIKDVLDLGAQNNYAQPKLPAPYMREWYKERGIVYDSIDLNGENGAIVIDLSKPVEDVYAEIPHFYDMVVDAGTSEHVGKDGAFSWEAIYNCWRWKHTLLKLGGIMHNENPMTGNWPGHGFNYYNQSFYQKLEKFGSYEILELTLHPAMNNTKDGWNVCCTLRKKDHEFPTLQEFMKLPIFTS